MHLWAAPTQVKNCVSRIHDVENENDAQSGRWESVGIFIFTA